jgi:DNA-binding MarR family transcriptional regulator
MYNLFRYGHRMNHIQKKYTAYQSLEERMRAAGCFFSEYFRRTMGGAAMDEPSDLTLLELKGLSVFADRMAEYTMSELSKNLHLPLSNMTVIIKRLEAKGIVLRRRSQDDRRIVRVSLTEHGRTVLNAFMRQRMRELENTLGKLSKKDQQDLLNALITATDIFRKISY